jgi:5'-nucleotidase
VSLILVDYDGVIVNWGKGYGRALDAVGPSAALIPRHENQRSFNLHEGISTEESEIVIGVMSSLDYYDMEPIEGAVEALNSMIEYGHDVRICTSPWPDNPNCIRDKVRWTEDYLGHEWIKRLIITSDKTMIMAKWLIDDKPDIKGYYAGFTGWTQVTFTQPYNRFAEDGGYRLDSWADWRNEEW